MTVFIKTYANRITCQTAAANYRWLRELGVRLPELLAERPHELEFAFVVGRHAEPHDLVLLAAQLGHTHAFSYRTELNRARLDHPHTTRDGHHIPDFLNSRLHVIEQRLKSGLVPDPQLDMSQVKSLMRRTADSPAAFYKDTNPRNVLITTTGPVLIDFDDLTLAPFGYDFAKLIVTLTMTHGPQPQISAALAAYNSAVANITNVSGKDLMTWTEIHHILTSPYFGVNGYTNAWDQSRESIIRTVFPACSVSRFQRPASGH